MKKLYLFSICEKVTEKDYKYLALFHFKGVYKGKRVREILAISHEKLIVNTHYLLQMECIEIKDTTLIGEVIRIKMINI